MQPSFLKKLPPPTRSNSDDEGSSLIWSRPGHGFRIKCYNDGQISANEYEIGQTPEGMRTMVSTRQISGAEIVEVMAGAWFRDHWPSP
jgi:hypothetical protein